MKKTRIAKSSKRRLLIFGTLSFIIIGYFCVSLFTYMYKITSLTKEKERLSKELANLQANEQNLKIEIQKLKDPDYVARFAREHYLYTKDGEYVIKIETNKETNITTETKQIDKKYIVIASTAGVILILVFIVVRKKKKRGK